jgi:hypothetical protein
MTSSDPSASSPFLNTTEVFPEDDSQLLIKHTDVYTNISNAVNVREIGLYSTQELITGQQFPDITNSGSSKFTYRKIIYLPAIATGGTYTVAHGITNLVQFTSMYGTCVTELVDYRPIPFADEATVTNQIALTCDAVNLNIYNGSTAPDITSGIVVLEYLLN